MKSLGFHHLAVFARDVERVAAFYRAHLALPELQRFHREDGTLRSIWLGVSSEGAAAEGFLAIEAEAGEGGRGDAGFSMLALRIAPESRAEVKAALLGAGIRIERETGWTMYLRDPEGNLIGLSHHPLQPPG